LNPFQNQPRKTSTNVKIHHYIYASAIAGALHIANAQSLDNLGVTGGSSSMPSSGPREISVIFETGSASSSINDFTVRILATAGTATGSFTVSLYSVSGALPNVALGTVTGLSYSVGTTDTDVTFSSANLTAAITGVTLSPNTQYAIAVKAETLAGNSTLWRRGSAGSPTATGGWTYLDSASRNGANPWSSLSQEQAFAINSSAPTPVPESNGSIAGIGLAMAGLLSLRRRKIGQVVS
jgi:hypothetical protein